MMFWQETTFVALRRLSDYNMFYMSFLDPTRPTENRLEIVSFSDFTKRLEDIENKEIGELETERYNLNLEVQKRRRDSQKESIVPEADYDSYVKITEEKEIRFNFLNNFPEQVNENPYLLVSETFSNYFKENNCDFSNISFLEKAIAKFQSEGNMSKRIRLVDENKVGAMRKVFVAIVEQLHMAKLVNDQVYKQAIVFLEINQKLD